MGPGAHHIHNFSLCILGRVRPDSQAHVSLVRDSLLKSIKRGPQAASITLSLRSLSITDLHRQYSGVGEPISHVCDLRARAGAAIQWACPGRKSPVSIYVMWRVLSWGVPGPLLSSGSPPGYLSAMSEMSESKHPATQLSLSPGTAQSCSRDHCSPDWG